MADRIVVLRTESAVSSDACAALADAVNEIRACRASDRELVNTYAEMVAAYSRLVRPMLAQGSHGAVHLAVIDHLIERLRQARAGEITTPVLDFVDRLHAELTRETTLA